MTTGQALQWGFLSIGPVLLFVGVVFAITISMSPYYHLIGKGVAWPLAPIAGLVGGALLGSAFLPSWHSWGIALCFGHGFFATWIVVGLLSHDDTIYHLGRFFSWIARRIASRRRRRVRVQAE